MFLIQLTTKSQLITVNMMWIKTALITVEHKTLNA